MSGIKTGNKGFVNPADGKVYTVDPNGNADEVSSTYDPGDMTVDQTVKDVNKKTKITLGTYLSKATKGEVGAATKPNKYPIDASTEASIESSLRDSGYPAGLTPSKSGNTSKFNSDLPSSLSKDFSDHQGVSTNTKIIKGLSAEVGQDGHVLLKSVTPVTDPNSPVQQYQGKAFDPNYRSSIDQFTTEDILFPAGKFEYKLIDYNSLQKVEPKDEVVKSSDLKLTLSSVFNFASKLTNPAAEFISLTTSVKNSYPVSAPDKFSADSLYPITTDGVPSPLTAGTNKNTFVFNDNLPSSYSAEFDSVSGQFKKGKQNTLGVDGHALLSKSIITDSFGFTQLNPSLQNYFENVAAVNFFYPNISNSGLSSEKAFLSKQIDISSPPRSFEPIINIGTSFGKYSGKESLKTQWNLIDQRKKASEVTQVNQYSVDPPVGGPFDILIPTNDPSTSLPLPLSQNNKDSYVKREDIKPLSRDPSMIVPSDSNIRNFSKGKESSLANAINGNELLKDVPGGMPGINESNPLHNYVGGRGATVLNIGNNRWTNSSRIEAGFNPTMKLADGTVVSHLKLAQVGTGLLQRAAAEIPAWISSQDNKFNPNGVLADAGSILPSVTQLGILKVNNALLEAKDVLNSISGVSTTGNIENEEEAIAEDALTSIAPFDGQSWGTLTSPSEPFEDPSSIGLSITMFLLVIAISLLFGLFEYSSNPPSPGPAGGQLALGKFKFYGSTGVGAFGLRPTNNKFLTCLGVGAKAFFIGASNARISDAQVVAATAGIGLDALIGEGSAVGANLTVARTIVRSGLVIAQYVDRIIKAASQNPLAGLQAAAGMTKILRSSKLVAALNVFAQLGDALLDREYVDIKGPDGDPLPGTGIDSQSPLIFHSTVRKNRLSYYDNVGEPGEEESVLNYNPELAWASKRAPSLYLIPPSIAGLQLRSNTGDSSLQAFGGASLLSQTKVGDKFAASKVFNNVVEKRISTEIRQKLEELLDAEYVPFYFHDIRTNEIISFHAFLMSLSDDYSSTYESVEGFGRVEPVKIYKGTQRKISIGFTIAATSQDDFHHMWFKINKLVTLAYPQYTSGRDLVGTNYQFKAPFSQMIGASPLIRLRLGDLFQSNYSRFGLARLFGATDGNMKILDDKNESVDVKFDSPKKRSSKTDFTTQFGTGKPGEDGYTEQFVGSFVKVKTLPPQINQPTSSVLEAEIVGTDKKTQQYEVKVTYKEPGISEDLATPATDKVSTVKVLIGRQSLELTEESLQKLTGESEESENVDAYDPLVNFMNPNTNSIVKSFESAGGKGLAGVIESMNFDWYNQTTWEIAPGSTAPKMCKVTIAFSPIHDITPGIDHMGYNRAPIYPVGNAMNGRK